MNPIEKIREKHKNNTLLMLAAKPHRCRIINLNKVRSIGIIGSNMSESEQIAVGELGNRLSRQGCMVHRIDINPEDQEQVDKFGMPRVEYLRTFASYHYDVLIDTTSSESVIGLYATLMASSSLRVAYEEAEHQRTGLHREAYDLIMRYTTPYYLSKYISDILDYLNRIRKQ